MVDLTLRVKPKVDYLQVNFKTTDTGNIEASMASGLLHTMAHLLASSLQFSSNRNLTLHTGEGLYGTIM